MELIAENVVQKNSTLLKTKHLMKTLIAIEKKSTKIEPEIGKLFFG
jgi:hypothetical protein